MPSESHEVMKKHAKSFTLASMFFTPQVFEAATKIYHWCRYCDDAIDEAVGDPRPILEELLRSTRAIYDGSQHKLAAPFAVMKEVVEEFHIPSHYLFELLEGMRMDIDKSRYENLQELELYCFRVAGTVGLMMTHVMGLFHLRSLPLAVELGHAMQMTNIARDVKEDLGRGRIYLPQDWLEAFEITDPMQKSEQTFQVVQKLLLNAEAHYRSAERGLLDLPFRCAFAVRVALELYREIGRKILSLGPEALQRRVVVSKSKKFVLVLKASFFMLASIPARMFGEQRLLRLLPLYSPEKRPHGP